MKDNTGRPLRAFSLQHRPRTVVSAVLVIIGFNSLVCQSLLVREFLSVFKETELVLGIFFAFWLLWPALGSWLGGRLFTSRPGEGTAAGFNQLAYAQLALFLLIPATVYCARASRWFFAIPSGQEAGVLTMLAGVAVTTLPFGLIHGFQFTRTAAVYSEVAGDASAGISRTYLFDTLGDVLGGAVFGYLLVSFLSPLQTAAVAMAAVVVSLALIGTTGPPRPVIRAGLAVLVPGWVLFAAFAGRFDRWADGRTDFSSPVVETGFSKYGRYVVTRSAGQGSFFLNGGLLFSYPDKLRAEEIVHLTLTQTPNPERVLVVGLDPQVVIEALKYPIARLCWVEIDPLAVAIAKRMLDERDRMIIDDPRVIPVARDARIYVARLRGEPFDAAIINTGNPTTVTANRFYTAEFYRQLKRVMKPAGVIATKISSGENYLSREKKDFNGSIFRAIRSSFPHILPIPGEELLLVASGTDEFLTPRPETIGDRLRRQKVTAACVDEWFLSHRLDRARIDWITDILNSAAGVRPNRDDCPASSYYYLVLWGAAFNPAVRTVFTTLAKIRFGWLVAVLLAAAAAVIPLRLKRNRFIVPAVFVAGMTGMSVEIVTIIAFQTVYGYVYNLLGAVIAAFMAGIFLGAFLIQRRFGTIRRPLLLLALLILIQGAYAAALPWLIAPLRSVAALVGVGLGSAVLFPLFNLGGGLLVGAVFPLAADCYPETGHRVSSAAGTLYGADLAGGMAAGLLTSLFLLPLYGLTLTGLLLASVNAVVGLFFAFGRE